MLSSNKKKELSSLQIENVKNKIKQIKALSGKLGLGLGCLLLLEVCRKATGPLRHPSPVPLNLTQPHLPDLYSPPPLQSPPHLWTFYSQAAGSGISPLFTVTHIRIFPCPFELCCRNVSFSSHTGRLDLVAWDAYAVIWAKKKPYWSTPAETPSIRTSDSCRVFVLGLDLAQSWPGTDRLSTPFSQQKLQQLLFQSV